MTNKKNRKASLTISDLETIHALDQIRLHNTINSEQYQEHNEIFEEICQDAEAEDELMESSFLTMTTSMSSTSSSSRTRRTSIPGPTMDDTKERSIPRKKHYPPPRRHSTYNGRNRKYHRDAHATIKDYLLTIQDENHARRSNFVTSLMDFNLSYEVAMAASLSSSSNDMSPTLNLSCPILSYLKEDDEDSMELIMMKRPSLIHDKEEEESFHQSANWESLKDDDDDEITTEHDSPMYKTEYVVELSPLEEEHEPVAFSSSWGKKHRRKKLHSYQMLEQRLSSESHMSVVKSFGFHGMTAATAAAIGYPTLTNNTSTPLKFSSTSSNPIKEYEEQEDDETQNVSYRRSTLITTKQPCARGA